MKNSLEQVWIKPEESVLGEGMTNFLFIPPTMNKSVMNSWGDTLSTPQEFIPDLFIVGGVKKKLDLPPSKKISSGFIHTCSRSIFTPLTGLFMLLQLLF